jgi:hypothetical protein
MYSSSSCVSRGGSGDQGDRRGKGRGRPVRFTTGVAASCALALVGLLLGGCASNSGTKGDDGAENAGAKDEGANAGGAKAGGGDVAQQPRSVTPYWVDPGSNAARQVKAYRKDGKSQEASLMLKIARQPMAHWILDKDPEGLTRKATTSAAKAGRDALLVLYNLPDRDCGKYSKGGAAKAEAYRAFLAKVRKGIGKSPATVILEPDAIPQSVTEKDCLSAEQTDQRYKLIREAVDGLKKLPDVRVYMDVGHSEWVRDPRKLVKPLKQAGIEAADGFSLNVSNHQTTASSTTYGKKLSRLVGDKHFVIDTGRNGNGPVKKPGADKEPWCNPKGRALGEAPTTKTSDQLVDDYLWVKPPGESDGECKGGPKPGEWWPEYALGLARNAR